MIINAFIKGQALTLPRAKLVAGSNDYLELRAVFQTGDWSGLNVWAHFTQDSKNIFDLELHDGKINKDQHLNLAEGLWKVYFTGMEIGSGTLKITTEVQTLTVEATGVTCGGFPDVPPSHAEQITKDAAEAKRLAQEALDTVTDNLPLTERAEAAAKAAEGSAKNSAQSAEASAESAASSAMSARRADESAQAASGSAAAATAAQSASAGSATESAESAQQAKGYEDEARRQAVASAGSASAAQKSAAAAKGSENTVKADADRTSTAAGKATQSEQNAQAAAEAAKGSEDSALASQQAAETAASDASASATTAGQKATAAAGSAEQAQKAANNAEKSALSGGKDADRAEAAYNNATTQADRAKSEADRATEAAENAGRGYTNQVAANALTRTVQGEVIALDDVSPLEHEVKCAVSGVPDLSKVTVSRYGKNLFDAYAPLVGESTNALDPVYAPEIVGTNTMTLGGWLGASFGSCPIIPVISGTVTVSANIVSASPIYSSRIMTFDKSVDGIIQNPHKIESKMTIGKWSRTISVPEGDRYLAFFATANDASTNHLITMKDIQVSIGDFTEFESTNKKDYAVSPEGIVSGMTSLSPNMTVLTDTPGALLDVSYNQDSMAVIKKLSDRITELENNAVK